MANIPCPTRPHDTLPYNTVNVKLNVLKLQITDCRVIQQTNKQIKILSKKIHLFLQLQVRFDIPETLCIYKCHAMCHFILIFYKLCMFLLFLLLFFTETYYVINPSVHVTTPKNSKSGKQENVEVFGLIYCSFVMRALEIVF